MAAASADSAGQAGPGASGIEHFQFMTTSGRSDQGSIIATGVFTAGGVDIRSNTTDMLKIPGGTVKVRHVGAAHGKQTLNPSTCRFTARVTGRYTVGGGTGKYAGISGHGTTILAVAARNSKGKCSQILTPVAWQQVIKGSGRSVCSTPVPRALP